MKKFVLIAIAALITSAGVTYSAHNLRTLEEQTKCDNFRCQFCKGTGWQPNSPFKCGPCKGTGAQGNY
jgi:hypothetical protein